MPSFRESYESEDDGSLFRNPASAWWGNSGRRVRRDGHHYDDLKVRYGVKVGGDLDLGGDLSVVGDTELADPPEISNYPWAFVNKGSAQTGIGTSFTALTFGSESEDPEGMHSTVSNTSRLTVPVKGIYMVHAQINVATISSSTGRIDTAIYKNGSAVAHAYFPKHGTTASFIGQISTIQSATAGQYFEVFMKTTSGTIDVTTATYFKIALLAHTP